MPILLEKDYLGAEVVVLIMEKLNSNTHSIGVLYDAIAPAKARELAHRSQA